MDEFRELNRRYPLVLFPAFRLQDNLQRGSLGQRRWRKILELRQKGKMLERIQKDASRSTAPDSTVDSIWNEVLLLLRERSVRGRNPRF